MTLSWRVVVIAVVLLPLVMLGGCRKEPVRPPDPVQHLAGSQFGYHNGWMEPFREQLDGEWKPYRPSGKGGNGLFLAYLSNPVDAPDEVPAATATSGGRRLLLRNEMDYSTLGVNECSLMPGGLIPTGIDAELTSNGNAKGPVQLREGPVEIIILADGTSARGVSARMEVFFNRRQVAIFQVDRERRYVARAVAVDGTNTIEIRFTNDFFRPPEDRNLYVRNVTVLEPAVVIARGPDEKDPPHDFIVEYAFRPSLEEWYRPLEPAPGLTDGLDPWRYYELGRETLPAIPIPPPGKVAFRGNVDSSSILAISFATVFPGQKETGGDVSLHVEARRARSAVDLDDLTISPQMEISGRWISRTYPLDKIGPGEAEILVQVEYNPLQRVGAASVARVPEVLISEPEIFSTPAAQPKNVILVSLDTLRADHLGAYGYGLSTSPNLDDYGESCLLYENAIAQSSWTLPSHASMLTSLYPSTHHVRLKTHSFRGPFALASILKSYGFQTKGIADGGYMAPEFGLNLGFDSYEDHGRTGFESILPATEKWLKTEAGSPFFLFVHTYDTHSPYRPPERFRDRFPSPSGVSDDIAGTGDPVYLSRSRGQQRERDLRYLINMYDAGIMYVDERMAELLNILERLDLMDSTLLIITSDHGEELSDHGSMGHGKSLYEEVIRVPLFIHVPGVEQGQRIQQIVEVLDIPPTVFEYLGIDPELPFQGRSLLPGPSGDLPPRDTAYAELMDKGHDDLVARRTGEEKLIYGLDTGTSQLYDLTDDPREMVNVAEKYPDRLEESIEDIREFRENNESLRGGGETNEVQMTDELEEKLRQLGYMH